MHRTPTSKCLNCSASIDAASSLSSNADPSPGDISICFYCSRIMIFTPTLTLRNPTDPELIEIAGNPDILHTMSFISQTTKRKN